MSKHKTKHQHHQPKKHTAPKVKVGDSVNVVIQNSQGQHILRPATVTKVEEDVISAVAFTQGAEDGLQTTHAATGLTYNPGEEIANTWSER